ncbi:ribonuclease T2 family protein [Acinetobacter tandoii]|jgi:ribonuclease T2|uniref:Uncharacterized protein n=1 Tax=Acinetobacter tandoii DSM 14970 = CIP 107469 TaxID=1120927 RepID=R9AT04_9GAMM|nr:hypothetical protein [Acinetobacter tandoii]EOR03206.1 hypothetical protein I593_03557 [Acinetobacter tandoii DSM 14970 = CIP 107469]
MWFDVVENIQIKVSCLIIGGLGLAVCTQITRAASSVAPHGYVMEIQMTPAACMMDSQRNKRRKCLEGYSLNILGLLPETAQRECETSSSANLSPLQAKVVARVMPDENARVQLWQSIGGCVPMGASQYFRTIINYAERLKIPAELSSPETRTLPQNQIKLQFLRLNPTLPSNGIQLGCQSYRGENYLTKVNICYKTNGQYKQCSTAVVGNCPSQITIKGSY